VLPYISLTIHHIAKKLQIQIENLITV